MILFLKLILAHLIGDFILQPNKWIIDKETNKLKSKYLYIHVFLHFLVTMVLLWDLSYWKVAVVILISHYVIDALISYCMLLLYMLVHTMET